MAVFSCTKTFQPVEGIGLFCAFPEHLHDLFVYVYLFSSATLLILLGLLNRRIPPFLQGRICSIIASALAFTGSAMLLFGACGGTAIVSVSAVLMGFGTSLYILLYGASFASFEYATCVINATLAVALGIVCAVALVNWVPSPISGIAACLMPILICTSFWKRLGKTDSQTEGKVPIEYVKGYLLRLAGSMALLGLVLGSLRVVCASKLLSSGSISIELVVGGGCITSVAVFIAAIALSKRDTLWDSLIRNITPVIMIGCACLATLAGQFVIPGAFFSITGFACIVALTWVLLASFSRDLNGSSLFVFGTGYGIIQAASVLGALLANSLLSSALSEAGSEHAISDIVAANSAISAALQSELSTLAIILMVVYSGAYALMPRYRELKSMLASLMVALAQEKATSHAAMDTEPGAPSPTASEDATSDSKGDFIDRDSIHPMNAIAGPHSNEKAASRTAIDATMVELDETEGAAPENVDEEKPQETKGSFKRRCEEISDKHKLSTREREVFFLLAKGHNAAFITEQLCISRSTAKTHINHIYKKLTIHTQQELLKMVEDRKRGPIGVNVDRETLLDAVRRAGEEVPIENSAADLVEHVSRDFS